MTIAIQNNSINNNSQTLNKNKSKFTDKFETKLRNSADINDCVAVPRTIFKGYLGIMFGTMLASGANLLKKGKLRAVTNIAALGLSAYGTWAFARPYVLKGAVPNTKPVTKN